MKIFLDLQKKTQAVVDRMNEKGQTKTRYLRDDYGDEQGFTHIDDLERDLILTKKMRDRYKKKYDDLSKIDINIATTKKGRKTVEKLMKQAGTMQFETLFNKSTAYAPKDGFLKELDKK